MVDSPKVLCQITNWQNNWQEIEVHQCLALQTVRPPQDCFGCDACSRRCAKCCRETPVCPELDLCQRCLAEEEFIANYSSGRYSWLICEKCHKRPVYPHWEFYGLCLHCAAKEFFHASVRLRETLTTQPPVPQAREPVLEPKPKRTRKAKAAPSSNGHDAKHSSGLDELEEVIVALHRDQNFQFGQIALTLGLSETTVSRMYSEASEKLEKSAEI